MLPEFKKRIDTLRDILVGAVPSPAGQIEQITYALIYKFMNDIDDRAASLPGGKRTYFTGEYEKYGWHELMTPTLGAHDRLTLYREALGGLAKNPGLPELFQGIYQNAYLTFSDPRVLTLFLKEIDNFKHSSSDDIGDAYEYLLQITGAQGDVGQFRTPRHIIKFIVEAVNPSKDDSVLDPAVGTAGFLIAAYNHVRHHHDGVDDITGLPTENEQQLTSDEREKLYRNYHGFDIDPTMVRTAKVNMYLHGFKTPDIKNHDSLSSEDFWNERYDVILANPPFMSPKGGIKPHDKFGIIANRAEVLFVDYIASHLKPTGRAGIVVPEGIIFQSGKAYKELRKNLVDNYLYAVVSLPAGVFQPYSGVKTSVLLLDREIAKQRNEVLFVKVENDGYSLGAQRRETIGSQFPEALELIRQFQNGEEITSELAHSVACDNIAGSGDYSLSGDKYKSIREIDSEWPLTELSILIDLFSGSRQRGGAIASGIPSIGGEQIAPDGNIRFEKMKYVSSEHFDSMKSGILHEHDVLVVKDGATTGKTGYWSKKMPASVNEHVYIMRPKINEQLDSYYLYSVIKSEHFGEILKPYIKGIIGGISREILNIKIPLPPIKIQREIVANLKGYQKIVDAAQTIVKYYRPTIKINSDWPIVNLPEAAEINKASGDPVKIYGPEGNFAYIDVSSVGNGNGVIDFSNKISASDAPSRARRIVRPGDVLLSTVRPNLKAFALIEEIPSKSLASTGFAVLTPRDNILPGYLYFAVCREQYVDQLIANMGKGSYPSVNTDDLNRSSIPLPPLEEQKQIVAQLKVEQALIDANKKLIDIYSEKIKIKIAEIWGE